MAFVVLALFVLLRIYQLLFQHRQLKRERLRANYLGQAVLGVILTAAALVLCDPRVIGLPADIFGFGPTGDESGVANVASVSRGPKKPAINWGGPLAGVEKDIDKADWTAAARKLFEPRRNGVKEALIVCSWDPYVVPLARAFAALGREAADKKDRVRARELLTASVDLAPDSDVYLLKASFEDPEDWKIAIDDLERASRRAKPGDYRAVEARLALRLAHLAQGETRGALTDCDALLAARPSDVDLLIQRGRLRLALGAMDGAIADLDSACRARPTDVVTRLALADARVQRGSDAQLKLALADLDATLAQVKESDAPKDAFKARILRAQARLALRQASLGLPDASRAIQIDPKSADAYYVRGRIQIDMDRVIAAKSDLEQAIKLDDKHRRAHLWHGILIYEKNPRVGLQDFTRANELEPDAWTQYYRAECFIRLNRLDEAESALTEAQMTGNQDEKLMKLVRDAVARLQALKRH